MAKALRGGDPAALEHELGDALAWLASVANLVGVDLAKAVGRYAGDCPRCGATPCACPPASADEPDGQRVAEDSPLLARTEAMMTSTR